MNIFAIWQTRRFELEGNEDSGFYLSENTLGCKDIIKPNLELKRQDNQ